MTNGYSVLLPFYNGLFCEMSHKYIHNINYEMAVHGLCMKYYFLGRTLPIFHVNASKMHGNQEIKSEVFFS